MFREYALRTFSKDARLRWPMETLAQIEQAIIRLSDDDFRNLYHWIIEQDHQKWDQQIAEDSAHGFLDDLAKQALDEYQQGLTTKL